MMKSIKYLSILTMSSFIFGCGSNFESNEESSIEGDTTFIADTVHAVEVVHEDTAKAEPKETIRLEKK